jgi:hypothetical protein
MRCARRSFVFAVGGCAVDLIDQLGSIIEEVSRHFVVE